MPLAPLRQDEYNFGFFDKELTKDLQIPGVSVARTALGDMIKNRTPDFHVGDGLAHGPAEGPHL